MKDSQLGQVVTVSHCKYIKVNNERFSTVLWRIGEYF